MCSSVKFTKEKLGTCELVTSEFWKNLWTKEDGGKVVLIWQSNMLLDTQELLVANIDSWMQEHLFLFYPRLLLVTKCWYQPWHVYLPHIQVNLDPYSYPANFNFHPCLLVTIFFSTEYIIWQLYQRIPTKSAIVVLSMQPIVVVDLCMNLNKDELPDTSADLTTENDQLGKVLTHNL